MKRLVLLSFISCFGYALFMPFPTQAYPESSLQVDYSYSSGNKTDKKPHKERRSHKKLRKKNKQRKVWY